jgi:hypothetical protein
MTSTLRLPRPLLLGAVVLALACASTGCSWFKHKSTYTQSVENQPLEVPPGMSQPDTSAATTLPPAGNLGAGAARVRGTDIRLADAAAVAYPKVGAALEAIPGVVINARTEALGSYDVTYGGENLLVRVQDSVGGTRLLALSPDGRLLFAGNAGKLLAAIKAKL